MYGEDGEGVVNFTGPEPDMVEPICALPTLQAARGPLEGDLSGVLHSHFGVREGDEVPRCIVIIGVLYIESVNY